MGGTGGVLQSGQSVDRGEPLELALDAAGLGVWTWEIDAGRLTWSRSLELLAGLPPGTFGGTLDEHLERIHPDDRAAILTQLQESRAAGASFTYLYRIICPDGGLRWIQGAGQPVLDGDGRLMALTGVCADVTEHRLALGELEQRDRHALLVAEVSTAFSSDALLVSKLRRSAQAVVDHLDAAFVRLWTLNQTTQILELHASAGLYTHLDGEHARVSVGSTQIGRIAARRQPYLTNSVVDDPEVSDEAWAWEAGMTSFAGYPLLVGGRCLGVLAIFARDALPDNTLDLLSTVADSIAVGIDQSHAIARVLDLLEQERRTHLALERENQLVETISRVGQAISARLDVQGVLQAVTDAVTELTRAAFGAFFYNNVDEHGESYLLYTISGVSREAFEGFPMPRNTEVFGPTFAGHAVRLDDVTADPRYGKNEPYHGMPPGHLPVRSYLAAPVVAAGGEVMGGLFLGHHDPGRFSSEDERVAIGVANQAAIAIQNARLYDVAQAEAEARRAAYEERARVANVLQQSLLPPNLPDVPGMEVAAQYASGSEEVGGDFYDLFPLRGDTWGLVIGDVCGRGPEAAALTALARHTVRTAAMIQRHPSKVLATLNRAVFDVDPSTFCSAVFATLRPSETGQVLTVARGGHPPLLVVRVDGMVEEVRPDGGLIGLFAETRFAPTTVNLRRGDVVIAYTDGITEARRPGELFGDKRLDELLVEIRDLPAEAIAARIVAAAREFHTGGTSDDMALLVLRVTSRG